eukprot:IDg9918t1
MLSTSHADIRRIARSRRNRQLIYPPTSFKLQGRKGTQWEDTRLETQSYNRNLRMRFRRANCCSTMTFPSCRTRLWKHHSLSCDKAVAEFLLCLRRKTVTAKYASEFVNTRPYAQRGTSKRAAAILSIFSSATAHANECTVSMCATNRLNEQSCKDDGSEGARGACTLSIMSVIAWLWRRASHNVEK